jgi:hypothetical protein
VNDEPVHESGTRARRWPWIAGGAIVALLALFYLGGGIYFSDVIDERALDGEAMRAAARALEPNVEVVSLSSGPSTDATITLSLLEDDLAIALAGVQGLRWADGYGRIEALGADAATGRGDRIERAFALVEGALPLPGTPAELDVRVYPMDPADSGLGLGTVAVAGPLGEYPAWVGQADGRTWAIVVHGNSLSPADGLRMVPILTDAGFPTLVATYRNAPGAPEDASGKLRYGLTEWQDLEAMVRYALEQGSDGVILDGYSMGGGIVMAFLQRSSLASRVRAVVLDAPMLDFAETSFLVFHGTADTTVPIGTSREFERVLPGRVELVECEGAEHIGCWNLDPDAYAARVQGFLAGRT